MPTCADVAQGAKSYLSGICELSHFKQNSRSQNLKAVGKVISYLLVAPVLIGLAVWAGASIGSSLSGRVTRDPNDPVTQKVVRVVKDIDRQRALYAVLDEARNLHAAGNGLEDAALDNFMNPPITKITNHLFVGNQTQAKELVSKSEAGEISVVFTCSERPTFADQLTSEQLSAKKGANADYPNGIKSIWAPFGDQDNEQEKANFKDVCRTAIPIFEDARKGGKKVLIHCNAGSSRSPSLAIAYRLARGEKFENVLPEIVRTRPLVNVTNFLDVLLDEDFINELKNLITPQTL